MDLIKKKILVTGADGFVGRHLIKNLLEKRKVPRENLFLPTINDLDLRKWEDCQKAVSGQDVVIHLAAKVGGIGFNLEKPGELFYDNLVMGAHLMEAARQAGAEKFVGVMTVCAYPKLAQVPFKEDDLWNGHPVETHAPYALAKKMLLTQAQAYRKQYGFNAISLLPANMYGPGDVFDPSRSHVVAALIKKFCDAKKENKPYVEIWGTGNASREFLYVKDGVEGILLAAEKYDKENSVNIGMGKEITIRDFAGIIAELTNFNGEIRWDLTKSDGQLRRALDISRAREEFGFEAKTNFVEGLQDTIRWYEQNEQNRPSA